MARHVGGSIPLGQRFERWSCRLRYHLGLFTSRLILYMAPYFKSDLLTFADAFGITNIRNQESGSLHVIAATVLYKIKTWSTKSAFSEGIFQQPVQHFSRFL